MRVAHDEVTVRRAHPASNCRALNRESRVRARAARVIDQISPRVLGFDEREWSEAFTRNRSMAWWPQTGHDCSAPADQRVAAVARLQQALAVS